MHTSNSPRARSSRRARPLAFALLLAVCVACGDAADEAPPEDEALAAPSVILISLDTVRADHLSCYGYERETSPTLDRLAEQGMLFEHFYANSNHTKISHMTMFTGLLPSVLGMGAGTGNALAPEIPTIADRFLDAGYQTAAFADGGYLLEAWGFQRGFEYYDSRYERVEQKLDRVEAWLERAEDEPTFLFFHTYGAHMPFLPAEEHDVFTDPDYDGIMKERVARLRGQLLAGGQMSTLAGAGHGFLRGGIDERDIEHLKDLYDGCIRQVDAGVARLLNMLDQHGILENAWVVITSDHGEAFKEHGSMGHRQLHDEELHVPLIIRPPGGLSQPLRIDEVVGQVDLTPTLIEIAGLEQRVVLQGMSLLPETLLGSRAVHAVGWDGDRALIAAGHKLIDRRDGIIELFDSVNDPHERENLLEGDEEPAALPGLLALVARMLESSAELRARLGEPADARELSEEQLDALRALGYIR